MNIHRTRSIVRRPGRTKALAALAAAGLALAVAGPASAEPSKPPEKKGCSVQLQGPGAGQSIVYPDGYKFSVQAKNDGKTHTYTCNDGKWTETVSLTAGAATLRNVTVLGASGSLQVALLR